MNQDLIQSTGQSLLGNNQPQKYSLKSNKSELFLKIAFVTLLIAAIIFMLILNNSSKPKILPQKIVIPWATQKPIIMQLGTSRVFEVLYFSGNDNRTKDDFQLVTQRAVEWSVQPESIVQVDMYGRVEALSVGNCTLKVMSLTNTGVEDVKFVQVVSKRTDIDQVKKRIISFTGIPAQQVANLQKLVERYAREDAQNNDKIPATVKEASANPGQNYQKSFTTAEIKWEVKKYANGSSNTYVLRTNNSMEESNRDKYQYFIGDRYLPALGTSVIMIEDDKELGFWAVSGSGDVTHIMMKTMSYREKAVYMRDLTRAVDRYGMVSSATLMSNKKFVPHTSDNDGLWTAVFGTGQLMRYAVMKRKNVSIQQIQKARASALKALKADLMISHISGRKATIQAKIRHLNNTKVGQGAFFTNQYLKKGRQYEIETYQGNINDGVGMFGVDAGKTIDGDYFPGSKKYSFGPTKPEDWTETQEPATTKRYLDNYISRSFIIPELQEQVGGLWFHRNPNGTQTVVSGASTLYDFKEGTLPVLNLGDKDIPQVLLDIINVNGKQYNKYDITYKGDTSSDELIGHLFIYKVAFDILDQSDDEQNKLKQLVKETVIGYCQHLINNGYSMVDATGQGTKWAKLTRQLFTSDYTIQDTPLKAIQLLLSMKLAYYVSGQRKWQEEYEMLIDKSGYFDYLTTVSSLYERWKWIFTKADGGKFRKFDSDKEYSDIEIQRRVLYNTHFSDEQEAFLGYYLAFQLQNNPSYLQLYRKGMQGYWVSISQSQNPLWYYIYQLASPNETKFDKFGNNLLQIASWQLSRHMIDTRKYQAFIPGSRPDVIFQDNIAVNPFLVLQDNRTSQDDARLVNTTLNHATYKDYSPQKIYQVKVLPADERSLHKFNGATFDRIDQNYQPTQMEGATTYTLPYWFGVYHNMLEYN